MLKIKQTQKININSTRGSMMKKFTKHLILRSITHFAAVIVSFDNGYDLIDSYGFF